MDERGSIESPLRRVSAEGARWNHAAAGGLFPVYICRSITLDPVGCRLPIPEGFDVQQGEEKKKGGGEVGREREIKRERERHGSRKAEGSCRALRTCQNLRGIRTLDTIPLLEWSGPFRQIWNNSYLLAGKRPALLNSDYSIVNNAFDVY